MRSTLRVAACVLVLSACNDASDALAPGDARAVDGVGSAVAAGQADAIADLIAAQEATWAAKDAAAYAATYTEDAELINPVAGLLLGRDVIRNQHAFLFNPVNGPFRNSTSSIMLRELTFLTGTIALVKVEVTLTGFSSLPPNLPAVEPGVVRTRVTWIAVKRGGEWLIMHQQMTPYPPAM